MKTLLMGCVLLSAAVTVAGCGSKASTDQPIDQVQTEAATMSVDDLKAKVEAYKAEIAKCQARLSELGEQLKKVTNPLSDEEAKNIVTRSSDVTAAMAKLQERLTVYMNELAKKTQGLTAPQ